MAKNIPDSAVSGHIESVRDDPSLTPAEKEVTMHTSRETKRVTVYSAVSSVSRGLLKHPEFEVHELTMYRESSGTYHSVSPDEFTLVEPSQVDKIVSVRGEIPRGAVKISGTVRNDDGFAPVVSNLSLDTEPEDADE